MSIEIDEREIKVKTYLIDNLINLRENPSKMIADLETIKYAVMNTKKDNQIQDEVEKVVQSLKKLKSVKPLKVSEGLCRAANKQIEVFLQSGEAEFNQTTSSNKETAEVVVKRYVSKCGKIYQIQDSSNDEKRFLSRVFITNTDKERKNRQILLNDDLMFFGIAVKNLGRHFLVNLLFSEEVEEKAEYNIDDAVVEEINNLRTKSASVLTHYNDVERKVLNARAHLNEHEIDKFYDYIHAKGNEHKALKRDPILDELAFQMLHHSTENDNLQLVNHHDGVYIPAQENLEAITNRILSNFKYVENFIVQGPPQDQEEIIQRLLFTGRKHDNGNVDNIDIILVNENIENIGVAYEEREHPKTKKKIAFVSVFVIDAFSAAPKKPYVELFKEQFSRLRKNPKSYLDDLKNYLNKNKHQYDDEAKLKASVDKLESFLKTAEALPELVYNQELHDVANEYCFFIKNARNQKFYEEEDELLKMRLDHYIENYRHFTEIVSYGGYEPQDMIVSLLLREAEKDLKKSGFATLLGKTFKHYGVCERFLREKSLVCIVLTDAAKRRQIHDRQFKQDLIQDLNNVRRYPKAYMKYVGADFNPFKLVNSKSTPEDILLDFLFHTRCYQELQEEKPLNEAAQRYVFDIINENKDTLNSNNAISNLVNKVSSDKNVHLKNESTDFLKQLLSNYGSGFSKVCNIVENNYEDLKTKIRLYTDQKEGQERGNINSKEYLIHILKDEENRKNIFSLNSNFFGICVHEERKLVNIILVNDFSSQTNLMDYSKTWQRKAPRPDLTEDEADYIRRDFKRIDIFSMGVIYPYLICKIFEEENLHSLNFIYYEALNVFQTEKPEEAKKGVNMEKFVEIVKHYMSLFSEREWIISYSALKGRHSLVESTRFKNLLDELKFKFNEEEAHQVFLNACHPEKNLSQKKFVDVMINLMNYARKNAKDSNNSNAQDKRLSANNFGNNRTLNMSRSSSRNSFK